tara:strand:+ start:140 stop:1198 length:1059 start_codon:yes stop_codon:yes gene_type:complete
LLNTNLEQYTIADFIDWHSQGRLTLNPHFQRNSVWTPAARTYLIDTILNDFPIPKIYIRSKIDLATKKSIREVVDGQQRLRTILDFAADKFALTKRSDTFVGSKYSTLSEDLQGQFLRYNLSVDHLMGATDSDVLEVFARLNSYGVKLNAAERRHAEFQGDFKWTVIAQSKKWDKIWSDFGLLTTTRRLRMEDYSLIAECMLILLDGVSDGGQDIITKRYKHYDSAIPEKEKVIEAFDDAMEVITENLPEAVVGPIANPPHFLMLFAAVAHARSGIPKGQLIGDQWAPHTKKLKISADAATSALLSLAEVIEYGTENEDLEPFVEASVSTTHRIASRRVRFPFYYAAVTAAV